MGDILLQKPKVLICPLNWGLGHASRCIPLIRKLQLAGFEVIIAADGRALSLLQTEFGSLKYVRLPGFSPRFSKGSTILWKVLGWLPSLVWHTIKEHSTIQRIVKQHEISLVISDNRYGLFTSGAKTIFITHQIMIKAPGRLSFTEPILYRINRFFIQKYDYCWIPDLPGSENLSGDLSHKYPLPRNAKFIGLLSRFNKIIRVGSASKIPLLAVLSGPEPQRTLFQEIIVKQLRKYNQEATIVMGTPENTMSAGKTNQITMFTHLPPNELSEAISEAGIVVCRAGYSSLMDLAILGKKEVLIVPTPGQTEQEYLASRTKALGWFNAQIQQNTDLSSAIDEAGNFKGIELETGEYLLDKKISTLYTQLADHQ
jgi:predicted glycosyltransferase